MLKLIAEHFIKPDSIAIVTPLYRDLIEQTRKEPLCIAYDLFVDQNDPGHFVFVEEWPDLAALEVHRKSAHVTRLIPLIAPHRRQEAKPSILMDRFSG